MAQRRESGHSTALRAAGAITTTEMLIKETPDRSFSEMAIITARCLSSRINSEHWLTLLPSLHVGIRSPKRPRIVRDSERQVFASPAIIQADMNHADPSVMRAWARQATEIFKTQLLGTGTVEPLVALYFDHHIEQVEFQNPSVLEHFDVRTAWSFATCEPW
jgi:hypothetical protein